MLNRGVEPLERQKKLATTRLLLKTAAAILFYL